MTYWGGSTSRRAGYCACGEINSCEPNHLGNRGKCNCDNNQLLLTQDEGYLTDKTKLPVQELRFGDMGGTPETASISLGKLECMG
ncbi:EGF and laminin G domain-containing protein-like [Styela clava]